MLQMYKRTKQRIPYQQNRERYYVPSFAVVVFHAPPCAKRVYCSKKCADSMLPPIMRVRYINRDDNASTVSPAMQQTGSDRYAGAFNRPGYNMGKFVP